MFSEEQRKWWILLGTGIGGIIVAVDFSIVNTCLPVLQQDLTATLGQLQWISGGFGMLFAALLVTMGRLADLLGRRKLLYLGIVGFALLSLGAGFSTSPAELITFRILQGIAGATIFPCGMAITADAFPLNQRGRALGIYTGLLGIGLAFGPIIGAYIVGFASWRWIFFVNIPVTLVSLAICLPVIKESKASKEASIDWAGVGLLTLALSSLTFTIIQGPTSGWGSDLIVTAALLTVVGLLAFIYVEATVKNPLMPLGIFTNSGFLIGTIISMVAVGFSWLVIFIVPIYLHNILDKDITQVGTLLFSMTLGTVLAPPIAGQILDKYGSKMITYILFAFLLFSFACQWFFNVDSGLLLLLPALISFGIAWGIGNGIATGIALSKLPADNIIGVVTGMQVTLLNVSGLIALAAGGVILRHVEQESLLSQLSQIKVKLTTAQQHFVRSLLSDPEQAREVSHYFTGESGTQILSYFKMAFMQGYHSCIAVFFLLTCFSLVAVMITLKRH